MRGSFELDSRFIIYFVSLVDGGYAPAAKKKKKRATTLWYGTRVDGRAQGFPPANDFSGFYYPQGIPDRNPQKQPSLPMPHYHQYDNNIIVNPINLTPPLFGSIIAREG